MSLDNVVAWVTIAGFLLALVGVTYTILTLRTGRNIARAQLYLEIDKYFREFQHIHEALRKDGQWNDAGPQSPHEKVELDAYMALFERIRVMKRDKLLDSKHLRDFYEYRYKMCCAIRKLQRPSSPKAN